MAPDTEAVLLAAEGRTRQGGETGGLEALRFRTPRTPVSALDPRAIGWFPTSRRAGPVERRNHENTGEGGHAVG